MSNFLRNTWYVAMWSQDLKPGELQQRLILDEAIVLFRNASGQVAALLDRCPHRFVPLSLGKVCEGNSVQCPYHGLAFDATGVCVRNPNADGRIPPALRVRRFPVVERHGAIWVWMGDPAKADRALIPRNFEPGFKVALMNKDLDTFHAMAKELHVPVSFSNMAQHYQQAALAAGLGEKDTSVIFTLIEQRSALTPGKR